MTRVAEIGECRERCSSDLWIKSQTYRFEGEEKKGGKDKKEKGRKRERKKEKKRERKKERKKERRGRENKGLKDESARMQ